MTALRVRARTKVQSAPHAGQDTAGALPARTHWTQSPPARTAGLRIHLGQVAVMAEDAGRAAPDQRAGAPAWQATPDGDGGGDLLQASVHELLALALHAPPEPLPARAALEQAFHLPLGDVVVHRGPAAAAALARLHAPAAVYAGEMLLGDADPSLHVLAHEVVHVLQAQGEATAVDGASTAGDAEAEAQRLASRAEDRAVAAIDPATIAPLVPATELAPAALAAFSNGPARADQPAPPAPSVPEQAPAAAPPEAAAPSAPAPEQTQETGATDSAGAAAPGAALEEGAPLPAPSELSMNWRPGGQKSGNSNSLSSAHNSHRSSTISSTQFPSIPQLQTVIARPM